MKSLDDWFKDYAVCHQNPTNQLIHVICVPLIMYATLGLIWALPTVQIGGWQLNWFYPVVFGVTVFYASLSLTYALLMLLVQALFAGIFLLLDNRGLSVGRTSTAIFIAAWIGQFYGHKVEGKKPSFFKDVSFLLIGPLWVLKKAVK